MTTEMPEPKQDSASTQESGSCQFVTFLVGQEVFAVDTAPVQEIIRVPEVVGVHVNVYSVQVVVNGVEVVPLQ